MMNFELQMTNREMLNDEVRTPSRVSFSSTFETQHSDFASFDIRNSAFEISPVRRALIEADREMPSAEMRATNYSLPTSTFEIHPSNFASLPGQLFYSTQIPVCLWFLAKNKAADAKRGFRDRRKQTLFIDARKLGTLIDRVHRELTDADLEKITSTYHAWRGDKGAGKYEDVAGFCKSATTAEIAAHGHVLTPGRYVGAEEVEDDGDPFEEKMPRLVAELHAQFAESAKLEQAITKNLGGLGF